MPEILPSEDQLTEYQQRLKNCLDLFFNHVFDRAHFFEYPRTVFRHYEEYLPTILAALQKLKEEDLEAHAAFIASNPTYSKLQELYPEWKHDTDTTDTFLAASGLGATASLFPLSTEERATSRARAQYKRPASGYPTADKSPVIFHRALISSAKHYGYGPGFFSLTPPRLPSFRPPAGLETIAAALIRRVR